MARSIHAFVEFERDYTALEPFAHHWTDGARGEGPKGDIVAFNLGEFLVGTHYQLFDALGAKPPYVFKDKSPAYEPRGLPSPVSFMILERYYCVVSDPKFMNIHLDATGEFQEEVSIEEAEEWVSKGLSHYAKRTAIRGVKEEGRKRVSNPDWHSASWLYLDEVRQALQQFSVKMEDMPIQFQVIVEIMESFEKKLGRHFVRLVYWFDN